MSDELEIDVDVDDGVTFAAAAGTLVSSLGGGFMISSQAKAFAKGHGLRGWAAYVVGRGSVLGDVDADVVTAAFGFWPSDVVRESWDAGRAAVPLGEAITGYAAACHEWGRQRYADLDDAGRLAELLSWVVDGCDVAGLPLFAGWRAVDLPGDDPARLNQLLHVAREHRGGTHLLAVLASGLSPLQAVLTGPGGHTNASFFGWEEPFEDVSGHVLARSHAEVLTNQLVSPAYDVLGHDERVELLTLLERASQAAFRPTAA
jgi:hypothetical protein